MANTSPNDKQLQQVKAGRNAEVIGRDKTTTTNVSIWIPFLLIGVIALGGIAWAINAGWLAGSGNPQQVQPRPSSNPTSKTTSP